MQIAPETASTIIVLVGNMNPAIFHPDWFRRMELFTEDEYKVAKIEVVHPEVSMFSMDWLKIRVEPKRFLAETSEEPYARLLDLVLRVFGDFLSHTPVEAFGVNYNCHFPLKDFEVSDRFGETLAPRKPWGVFGEATKRKGSGASRGGLRSITLEQLDVDERPAGHFRATVAASTVVIPGIQMQTNDEYRLVGAPAGCGEIISLLRQRFDDSIARSKAVTNTIMELAQKC